MQEIFEYLYALSFPLGEYLDFHMIKIDKSWYYNLFLINEEDKNKFINKTKASELDIYYQAKILTKNWWI